MKKTLKSRWESFRQWQRNPHSFFTNTGEKHECLNCGNSYHGNFCPVCGQSRAVTRFTWHGVLTGAMDVWGLGGRSMPRNIQHLILRPGYMIADYLAGKRQPYFPPFKMLFLMVALVALLKHYAGFDVNFDEDAAIAKGVNKTAVYVIDFIMEHRIVATLSIITLMALIVRWFFGADKRTKSTNLCECIYTQVWMMNQLLIFSVVFNLLKIVTGVYIENIEGIVLFFVMCVTYKQLFGLRWWSTVWRTAVMLLLTFTVYIIIIFLFAATIEISRQLG